MSGPFEVIENPDPRTWDEFMCAHNGNLLQSSAWGDLKTRFGWTATRTMLARSGAPVAGAQILSKSLPLGLQLAYVPRGPVVDPSDSEILKALLDVLSSAARARGAFALRLEPDWTKEQFASTVQPALDGFRNSPGFQPQSSIHLDLTRDLDTILAEMKPKWRYNIRLAARKGVTVREASDADLPLFYQLLQTTSARDRFAIHSFDYYRTALAALHGRAALLIAEWEGQPLAGIIAVSFGNQAIYLYGASSSTHREYMPNHALHWAAIQWAKTRGCLQYDLWGIDGTLYQFKQGFGGTLVHYVGAYDRVFSRAQFALYSRALHFRRAGLL